MLSLTNTEWIPRAHTTETAIFSWSVSTSTTTRQLAASKYRIAIAVSFLIRFRYVPRAVLVDLSQERWTLYALAPSAASSAPTTSFSGNLVRETIGPKDTTQKAQSWLTQFSTLFAKKQNHATASR